MPWVALVLEWDGRVPGQVVLLADRTPALNPSFHYRTFLVWNIGTKPEIVIMIMRINILVIRVYYSFTNRLKWNVDEPSWRDQRHQRLHRWQGEPCNFLSPRQDIPSQRPPERTKEDSEESFLVKCLNLNCYTKMFTIDPKCCLFSKHPSQSIEWIIVMLIIPKCQ